MRLRGIAGLIGVFTCALLASPAFAATPADSPTASFTANPAAPLVGQMVTFDASASSDADGDSIASYSWNFGDGDSQMTTSPTTTHIFAKRGSYTVSLIVTDSQGNPSAATTSILVVSSVETGPSASFKVTPKSPIVGQTAVFDGSKSSDQDGDLIVSYRWTFGDGSSQTTSSPTTAHAYAVKGTYTATLTVVDSRGTVSATASHSLKVKLTKKPPSYHVPSVPTARFTFTPSSPVRAQLIVFNASSSSGDGHKIKHYLWAFGDGASASSSSPIISHAYGKRGTFSVQLVVQTGKHTFSVPAIEKVTVGSSHHHKARRVRLSKLHVGVCVHRSNRCPARGFRIRFRLSKRDAFVVTIFRRGHKHALKQVGLTGGRGRNTNLVRFKGKRHAHYVLRFTPIGGRTATARVVWRR